MQHDAQIIEDDWVETENGDALLVAYAYGDGKTLSCCGLGKYDSFPILRADVKRLGPADPTLMVRSLGNKLSLFYCPALELWLTAERLHAYHVPAGGKTTTRPVMTYVVSPVQATTAAARALSHFTVYAAFLYQLEVCAEGNPLYRVAECENRQQALDHVTAHTQWDTDRQQAFREQLIHVKKALSVDEPSPAEQILDASMERAAEITLDGPEEAETPEFAGTKAPDTRPLTQQHDLTFGTEHLRDASFLNLFA